MAIEKYRVRDVARDFGLPAKVITDILASTARAQEQYAGVGGQGAVRHLRASDPEQSDFQHCGNLCRRAEEAGKRARAQGGGGPKAEPAHKAEAAPAKPAQAAQQSPPCLSRRRSRRPSSRLKSPRSRWCSSPSRSTASPRPLPSPPPAYRRRSWWTPARAAT